MLQQDGTVFFVMLQNLLQARKVITVCMSDEEKQYEGDWEKITKYVKVLDLFCQATVLLGSDKHVACSCALPLLSSLTRHMAVNDDDPGYIARFKATSVNDLSGHVADMKSVEILRIATSLHPRYNNLMCSSHDAKDQTWSLIGQQIASDDSLKANAYDDTHSVNKTIC